MSVLITTLNCIRWWDSCSGDLRSVESFFIAITPKSTLTWSCCTCKGFIYGSNRSVWFGLVSLFNGISTLFRLFNAKAILLEEQYYFTHSWEDKGVHTFPKGICPKVKVIARLEYKLAYYDSAVHCFNHYTMRTPLNRSVWKLLDKNTYNNITVQTNDYHYYYYYHHYDY